MDDIERLLIERSCERLMLEYCHLVDHGQAGEIASLFTANGVWTGPGVTMTGADELRRGFEHRQRDAGRRSRHVCSNALLDVVDADHAEGTVYVTLYRHDGEPGAAVSPLNGPAFVGEYRDTFRRTTEGWRFATRACVVDFLASES